MIAFTKKLVLRTSRPSFVPDAAGRHHPLGRIAMRWLWPSVVLGTILIGCTSSSVQDGGVGRLSDSGTMTSDGPNADSGLCMISASNYDQSCTVDTDCSMVSSGDYCSATCLCGGSAINVGALAKFNADVAKTPLGSGALGNVFCGCPFSWGPCCRHGTCVGERGGCSSPSDSLPACADAGGTCMPFGSCGQPGPPDACAYSDEMCCVP
jgi:hypothetical protein